jgi:hypothetical protein
MTGLTVPLIVILDYCYLKRSCPLSLLLRLVVARTFCSGRSSPGPTGGSPVAGLTQNWAQEDLIVLSVSPCPLHLDSTPQPFLWPQLKV